jgi:hypothetical protein
MQTGMIGKHCHSQQRDKDSRRCYDLKIAGIIPAAKQATIAQPVEQTFRKRQVKSSNLFGGSIIKGGPVLLRSRASSFIH